MGLIAWRIVLLESTPHAVDQRNTNSFEFEEKGGGRQRACWLIRFP